MRLACRVLEVSESGYYARRSRAPSERSIRHAWLTDVIQTAHTASRGTYGHPTRPCRVDAGTWHRRRPPGCRTSHAVRWDPGDLGTAPLSAHPQRGHRRRPRRRKFHRDQPDQLWVTDITEHPTREASCIALSSSTPGRDVSWAVRSTQHRVPRSSPALSGWPSSSANPPARPSSTATRARNSPHGPLHDARWTPAYCPRWAPWATASASVRWRRALDRPSVIVSIAAGTARPITLCGRSPTCASPMTGGLVIMHRSVEPEVTAAGRSCACSSAISRGRCSRSSSRGDRATLRGGYLT